MFLFIIILFIYVACISQLAFGIVKTNKKVSREIIAPKTTFSIIVPFRNEANNLPSLLESISKLDYPTDLFEVILIDDESNDGWKVEVDNYKFAISIFPNKRKSNSPKKDAIETAIPLAKFDWIAASDADCIVPVNWLAVFDEEIQNSSVNMLVGSVLYHDQNSFLHHFQNNDMLSLQGVTAGSFGIGKGFMCNGANLAYKKEIFTILNGYEGNTKLASGDDVFLLQKIVKENTSWARYLGNQSVVYTNSCFTWKELVHQRVRWASKTSAYSTWYPKILGLVVFLTNIGMIATLLYTFFYQSFMYQFLYFSLVKMGIDFMFLKFASAYFQVKFKKFIPSFLIYPYFTIVVVFLAFSGNYQWKNRKLN